MRSFTDMEQLIQKVNTNDGYENPFMCNVTIGYVEHTVLRGTKEPLVYKSETMQSTKMFRMPTENLEAVIGMSSAGMKLLLIIMQQMTRNTEKIRISKKKFLALTGKGHQTFYNAIDDLVKAMLICKHKHNIYWVNTQILFNGDRLTKYPDKIREVRQFTRRLAKMQPVVPVKAM